MTASLLDIPRSPKGGAPPAPPEKADGFSHGTDEELAAALELLASAGDAWAFTDESCDDNQVLFQYPAMMVPQMQRQLLGELVKACDAGMLYDPFLGSGTTMAEAMFLGLDVVGQDINPLAVLVSRVKAGPFFLRAFESALTRVSHRARRGRNRKPGADWAGRDKWFAPRVARELAALRCAIRRESQIATRRFLWVVLAETVRLTSNSRTSTVKLHIRPAAELDTSRPSPLVVFERIAKRNLERMGEYASELRDAGRCVAGRYTGHVDILLQDTASGAGMDEGKAGVLLSSPPYGDNASTVPYGQQAYLPLRWIDLADIDATADERFLASTHAIDSMCLGAPTRGALDHVIELRAVSPSLDGILEDLASEPPDRARRVAAFWRDLDAALGHVVTAMRPGSLMAWTVGNRSVGGRQVPMDRILRELLEHRGAHVITTLRRAIPDRRKRQAPRNSIARTIDSERVLVLRVSADGSDA